MNVRKALTIGSLFAGIGGFDLAAKWAGMETKWFSEIEPYACAVLKKHWPNVPNHGDITKIKGENVEHVDILCGGFPCQDISVAQTRADVAGIEGERSGLWFHYARLIEEIHPKYAVIENSPALRSRGLDQVLGSLAAIRYDAEWHCIPAAYVGAPHRRDRIWIIAYPGSTGLSGSEHDSRILVSAEETFSFDGDTPPGIGVDVARDRGRLRTGDGLPLSIHRLRLHALGNAIVPQVAYGIFRAIAAHHLAHSPVAQPS